MIYRGIGYLLAWGTIAAMAAIGATALAGAWEMCARFVVAFFVGSAFCHAWKLLGGRS